MPESRTVGDMLREQTAIRRDDLYSVLHLGADATDQYEAALRDIATKDRDGPAGKMALAAIAHVEGMIARKPLR